MVSVSWFAEPITSDALVTMGDGPLHSYDVTVWGFPPLGWQVNIMSVPSTTGFTEADTDTLWGTEMMHALSIFIEINLLNYIIFNIYTFRCELFVINLEYVTRISFYETHHTKLYCYASEEPFTNWSVD